MNARQAAQVERWAEEDAAAGYACLLCGGQAHAVQGDDEVLIWDLCVTCDGVFQLTAARVAASMALVVDGPAAAALEHVAGQLELDDEDDEDGPAAFGLEDEDVAAVQLALQSGDFAAVDTMVIMRFRDAGLAAALAPWARRAGGGLLPYSKADNQALLRVLARRA